MKKDKGYGLLWMLAAEVVLFIFFLAIAPRLNAEGLLYRSAVPVTPEEVLSKDDNGSFELKYGAGYPCTEPTGRMTLSALSIVFLSLVMTGVSPSESRAFSTLRRFPAS